MRSVTTIMNTEKNQGIRLDTLHLCYNWSLVASFIIFPLSFYQKKIKLLNNHAGERDPIEYVVPPCVTITVLYLSINPNLIAQYNKFHQRHNCSSDALFTIIHPSVYFKKYITPQVNVIRSLCPRLAEPQNGLQNCESWGPSLRYKVQFSYRWISVHS